MRTTSQPFQREVLDSTVPVMVDFWAAWCGPCRAVAPEVEALADQYGAAIKVVKVDVDANQVVAIRYDIRGIPMIGLFEGGKLTKQVVGARPRHAIETELGLSRFAATAEDLIMHAIETTTELPMASAEAAVRDALARSRLRGAHRDRCGSHSEGQARCRTLAVEDPRRLQPDVRPPGIGARRVRELVAPLQRRVDATGNGTRISAVDPRELMAGDVFQELANEAAALLTAALAAVPKA